MKIINTMSGDFTFEELRGKYQGRTNLMISIFCKSPWGKTEKGNNFPCWETQFNSKQQHFVKLPSFK